jgi:hypothetical protein
MKVPLLASFGALTRGVEVGRRPQLLRKEGRLDGRPSVGTLRGERTEDSATGAIETDGPLCARSGEWIFSVDRVGRDDC